MKNKPVNPLTDSQYKDLFKASPVKMLVVRSESYEIVAVSDAFLHATMTRESDILGKTLFVVFPDDPQEIAPQGATNLRTSLQRVESLKVPDTMVVQRYPVRTPDGHFEERFWSSENSPILNDAGDVEFLMLRVKDVTAVIQGNPDVTILDKTSSKLVQEITLRSQELKQAILKVEEQGARMRTAERLLNLGTWEFNPQTQDMNWSRQVFDIYDLPANQAVPDAQAYVALLHPDDQERALKQYSAVARGQVDQVLFEHRALARDGSIRYIRGAGERYQSSTGEIYVGCVQDITSLVRTQDQLTQAEQLLKLAGKKSRLGGWRVELACGSTIWTPETAMIHNLPANYSPKNVPEAINYYAPEYQAVIKSAFEHCAKEGEDFDLVCQLQLADSVLLWVRVIGVAEQNENGQIVAVQGAIQDITALQEAKLRAETAEQQKLDVLESINDAVFALDKDWQFIYLNQQAEILLEHAQSQLIGKNIWLEFPDAVNSQFQQEYQKAFETQEINRFQAFYPPFAKWFDVSAYPTTEGLTVYFRDVTQERKHQEQMRLTEAALSRQNDIVIITTADELGAPDGPQIVFVNDAFERLTGYSKSEAIGKTPRMLQGPLSDRQQLDRIKHALINKQPIRCELLNYTKVGEPYWLELDITPLFDDNGLCTHYVAVERDITERKQHESELKQSQERFELLSKATNDVIWDWDCVTDKVWWNSALTTVFGYALPELEAGPGSWSSRIHPDDFDRVIQSLNRALSSKDDYWNEAYRFAKADGEYANVINRGFVLREPNGKAARMVGSVIDISERTHMEQKLRESQKLEAVGHLTGGVAHDFNNLLTVIMGGAETLVELETDPQLKLMAQMTLSAAQRGAELTSRLLAFSRRQPLAPKPTDLNQLVQAMLGLIRRTLPENIEVEFIPTNDLGITEIDANELDAALLNLVVNARDAMQNGGKLTIETRNTMLDGDYLAHHPDVIAGDYIMLCVSDSGAGMTPDTLARAFEPFFTTKSEGQGSGLGLSMVFGFTKQSDGHIQIYSELGEGTSIKLYFPRVNDASQAIDSHKCEMTAEGGTEHILIVEDDDLVLQHLTSKLCSLGYRVTTAISGPMALLALQEHDDVDLLLTDIIMPGGMNGRELAEQAKAVYPNLKVLYTSGYSENAIAHEGRLDPGVELLCKPYTQFELATKVRKAIKGSTT